MKWSIACCSGLVGFVLAGCGSHEPPGAEPDASSDVSTGGAGGTSSGGSGGTLSTGGSAGSAGHGGAGSGGVPAGGAGGSGGTAGVSGNGGTGGSSGAGGNGGAVDGGGAGSNGGTVDGGDAGGRGGAAGAGGVAGSGGRSGAAGGDAGGAAGAGGASVDGSAGSCMVDKDCPPPPCQTPPCPESLCAMGENGHRCVTREHPPYAVCPTDAGDCCTNDSQCTAAPNGYCIPYTYSIPWCTMNLALPPPQPGNRCLYDLCSADSDCTAQPNGFCSPDFQRRCAYGPCSADTDCNRGPGGKCVVALVCEWASRRSAFCRYPADPCRSNADCGTSEAGTNMFCVPNTDGHGTFCKDGGIPPT